jgi:aspartyl-tRNA(Asn)/glutamyl-tRNA(Gln) amidotransferase subunit C
MSEIDKAARLARIRLNESELEESAKQLEKILDYISQLESAETDDSVEPFFGAIESVNAIRSDEVSPSQPREAVLKNAPDTDGEFYVVPPVFK